MAMRGCREGTWRAGRENWTGILSLMHNTFPSPDRRRGETHGTAKPGDFGVIQNVESAGTWQYQEPQGEIRLCELPQRAGFLP